MPVAEMTKKSSMTEEERILETAEKIQRNMQEDINFSNKLDDFLNGRLPSTEVLTLGKTPNVLKLIGSQSEKLTINQSVIRNCMNEENMISHGHTSGHALSLDIMKQLPEAIRNPIMICKGSKEGSVVVVTELKNRDDKNVIVPIAIDIRGKTGAVNSILSAYGKDNLQRIIDKGILAQNEKKASELFTVIEANSSQSTSIPCFDNSIAYTTANVKYPQSELTKDTQFHSPADHEKLLPFLNAKAQYHESRLDTLKDKRDTRTAKIEKNENKIDKLSAKADKLKDMNKLLSAMAKVNPVVKAFVDRNSDKIKAIREEKIPAREAKIADHKNRIAEIDKKSAVIGHKLERCVALNDTVKSFAIIGADRRQAFAKSMDKLNKATFDCISDKRAAVIEQQQKLISQLNMDIEQIGDNTPAENLRQMQEQLQAIQPKLAKLDSKLARLKLPENAYVQKSEEHIDKLIENTQKAVAYSVESGKLSIPQLSESICESNAELAQQLEKENPFEYLKNAEMAMEDDYNSIDGIINNGKRNEEPEITDNSADEISVRQIAANMSEEERKKFIGKMNYELEAYVEPSEKDIELYNACVDIENDIHQKASEKSQKEQAAIKAWHELGDAYVEAYEERQIRSYTKDGKPVIASQTRTADNVIENVRSAELSHKSEIKAENWLNTMITDGKAVIKDDGSFKINPDYYKNLPRNDRHVEEFSNEDAMKILNELSDKNVQFSAVTRFGGKVAVTVSQKDVGELTDIIDKFSLDNNSKEANEQKPAKHNTVNPDYYKSLATKDRKTMTLSPSQSKALTDRLSENGILYSAVVKGSVTKLTVSKENEPLASNILKKFNNKYINPDFYKSLSKDERYTQRMDEQQAKEVVGELAKNRVEHSAVIDGEKSAVTIRQSDYPKAKGFFMNHNKFQQLVNNTKQKQAQKDKNNTRNDPKKNRSGLE